ncbi:MAG: protein-glutamate O-methyltransferase CheR [Spirochaetales bacterium]
MSTPLTPDELLAWGRYVRELCGITLDSTKGYLVETRLAALLKETGSASWAELLTRVRSSTDPRLRSQVIDAITTNETSFFRDSTPFELLQHKLIPELIDRRSRLGIRPIPIRILSAACSTGQEAYSIAITLKELLGDLTAYDVRILGVDISDQAVAAASYGFYHKAELMRGLSEARTQLHFEAAGDRWKVRDELRAFATFRKANLLEPFATTPAFDLIFCRNVAIYFSETDKNLLFRNLIRVLAPEGALLLGSTEVLPGFSAELEAKRHLRGVYFQKKPNRPAVPPLVSG